MEITNSSLNIFSYCIDHYCFEIVPHFNDTLKKNQTNPTKKPKHYFPQKNTMYQYLTDGKTIGTDAINH